MDNKILYEQFDQIELMGIYGLFSNGRIPKEVIPDGLYRYNLRGSDYDPGIPVTVEQEVGVNHAGTVVLLSPLDFGGDRWKRLTEESGLNFIGGQISIKELHKSQQLLETLTEITAPEQFVASAESMGLSFSMEEAKIVLGYLEGCDYTLYENAERDMFRHDIHYGVNHLNDEHYSVMDAVDFAVESNDSLIIENPSPSTEQEKNYVAQLHYDQQILDVLYERMQDEISNMSERWADEYLFDITMTAAELIHEGKIQVTDSRELFAAVKEMADNYGQLDNVSLGDKEQYIQHIKAYATEELTDRFGQSEPEKPVSLAQRLSQARAEVQQRNNQPTHTTPQKRHEEVL